jgi:GWxTD domain-containing protein
MMLNGRTFLITALGCGLIFTYAAGLVAQQTDNPPAAAQAGAASGQGQGAGQELDPLKRERSDKEKFAAQRAVKQELKGAYKTWLNQDVAWIISDEERKAFKSLSNDEERDAFIEQFWLRRNPNPDSPENEFREEHYRRIAYANEHFAAGKPGWKTDRGRIYIAYGPPDSIEAHPSGGNYDQPVDDGGRSITAYPFELWHYRYIESIGENVNLEFVDTCQCGDYHFTIDPTEKDARLHADGVVPNRNGDTDTGQKSQADMGKDMRTGSRQNKEFERLDLERKIFSPPPIKFADLDAFISEHKLLNGPVFPFDVRTDFVKVTENTDLVPITLNIKNRDITFVTKDGVSKGVVNILGKVTTMTHKTVQSFEDTVEVDEPAELLEKTLDKKSLYWKAIPLLPGLYRLDIVIKDVNNPDHIGIYGRGIEVPTYHDEKLGTSTLILSDQMYPVSSHDIGAGNCVIGNTHICPRISPNAATPISFKRSQDLNFWMQVYNLGINEATKSNEVRVTYQITDTTNNTVIFEKELESKDLGAHSDQLTVEKSLPMAGLSPGKYKVTIKVDDTISKQEIAQSAPFVVE